MAVASWMLRSRNPRSGRLGRGRDEDAIRLDLEQDPHVNAKEIFNELSKTDDLPDGKRLSYLNNYVKLSIHLKGDLRTLGYSSEEILYCLRYSLSNEATQVRSGAFRAIRHTIFSEDDVIYFNRLLIPYLVVRSLDMCFKNDIERIEAVKLIQKVLLVSPEHFDMNLARCLVALANGVGEEKDRLLRACLACLSELGILNPDIFIASGGVAAITRNLLECQTPKIAESLCGVLLLLLDRPLTRLYAGVDLHCVAAPYCDFHYRHGWMDINRDERELRFNCSRLALLSILRSWPGILHFCSPNDISGMRAIADVLYLNQLEVRKAVLDLLYELLNLPQPEWTDELSVALSAIDPAEPQATWRLSEDFVAAEGRSILPHLARTTPSINDMHLSLLLYCFLETGLLNALAEVISTSDTFISVRATVLLGELLRLIQVVLPPECCNIAPSFPNLLEYATKNRPQALRAVTALQQLHKLLKRRPASYSLYLDYILQSGNSIKSSHKSDKVKKAKLLQSKSRLSQFVSKDGSDVIKETSVLQNKDAFTWNWNLINTILKEKSNVSLDMTDNNHRSFLKRLVEYYAPSNNRYSHMDLTSLKTAQAYTQVGIELIKCLVRSEDAFCSRLLNELFQDISKHVDAITSSESAHNCLFNPTHMTNTQCQTYFLFIGRLGSTTKGVEMLKGMNIFEQLQHLSTTTTIQYYVKLIISSLDYTEATPAREVLAAVLTCSNEKSRLYATQFLLVLLRAGLPQFSTWGIKLLAGQLKDDKREIYLSALSSLHEACEVVSHLEQLVRISPELVHLGERGMLLLIRFLGVPKGYEALKKKNFVFNELRRWDEYYNYRYVFRVESEIADALTLHQRGDDGRYDKRTSSTRSMSRKDLFLPPHIYGQLAKHTEGFQLLLDQGMISAFIRCIDNGLSETEDDILKLKAALWALAHVGSTVIGSEYFSDKSVLPLIVSLAENSIVYSVRATAFYSLGLIATTRGGADALFKLGWVCTRHDRHDRWPIIEEENWDEKELSAPIRLNSESDRSDPAFVSEFCIVDADSSTTTDEDILVAGDSSYPSISEGRSLTLPHQMMSSVQHKRSLSESKTFELLRGHSDRSSNRMGPELLPHRYRDNSVTESTTSGVSSCESVLGKSVLNERQSTLTPIPSISSLQTQNIKIHRMSVRRHSESCRRMSSQYLSGSAPTDRMAVSPASSSNGKLSHQNFLGYETMRMIRMRKKKCDDDLDQRLQKVLRVQSLDRQGKFSLSYTDYETGIFGNYLIDGMSLTSLSSVKKFTVKESKRNGPSYMGVALPLALTSLFPDYERSIRRFSLSICKSFSGSDSESNSEVSKSTTETTSPKKPGRFLKHSARTCLRCSQIRSGLNAKKDITRQKVNIPGTSKEAIQQDEEKENFETAKRNILIQVELLGNPVAVKQAKQTLLDLKQRDPLPFQDLCLYSEVCKMLSESTYRLTARRFLQDIFFDVKFDTFSKDLDIIFSPERSFDRLHLQGLDDVDSGRYADRAREQRKSELSGSSAGKLKVVVGFNVVEEAGGDERFSPTKFEPRSPPLSSVKEEQAAGSSSENLLDEPRFNNKEEMTSSSGSNITVRNANSITTNTNKTDNKLLPSSTTLEELKLIHKENKFPIKARDDNATVK